MDLRAGGRGRDALIAEPRTQGARPIPQGQPALHDGNPRPAVPCRRAIAQAQEEVDHPLATPSPGAQRGGVGHQLTPLIDVMLVLLIIFMVVISRKRARHRAASNLH